ncbi:MAG TPA: creatininase family protein [Xanthobacteraceae bacterium]|nr:creatininase family protein [Xanthobacteraceae bacterium]
MAPRPDWNEMTWQDFASGDANRWIAVMPVAATEQHGPHLPVGVDAMIGRAYLARVRKQLPKDIPATFLPLQDFGVSAEHTAFPGTISVSAERMIPVWLEIGESIARAGVRKLVIVTSHGGNVATIDVVARELRVRHGMLAVTTAWQNFGYPDGLFDEREAKHGIHAGGIETALMLAAHRDLVRVDRTPIATPASIQMEQSFKWLRTHRPAGFGWMSQDLHSSGAIGDATQGTAEAGEAAYEFGACAFIELLRDVDRFDLAKLPGGPLGEWTNKRGI